MTAITVVKEQLTRPTPRRACCMSGLPLVVSPAWPSFHHDDPPRPCLYPANPYPSPAPRRAL